MEQLLKRGAIFPCSTSTSGITTEGNERKTSLEIVPISKISNSREADQKYKLNCYGKAIIRQGVEKVVENGVAQSVAMLCHVYFILQPCIHAESWTTVVKGSFVVGLFLFTLMFALLPMIVIKSYRTERDPDKRTHEKTLLLYKNCTGALSVNSDVEDSSRDSNVLKVIIELIDNSTEKLEAKLDMDGKKHSRLDSLEIVGIPLTDRENIYFVLNSLANAIDTPSGVTRRPFFSIVTANDHPSNVIADTVICYADGTTLLHQDLQLSR
ncbi:hypothetical protein J6590_064379 [Homalodisca vitripennis]|nr:hypothetical protein J6590_064379 [Homalodisca vitripennis]